MDDVEETEAGEFIVFTNDENKQGAYPNLVINKPLFSCIILF